MAQRLDDKVAADAGTVPSEGNRIIYDGGHKGAVKGFGLRVTKAGARSWVLNYRAGGVERRLTIGSFPDWKAVPARDEAARLKRLIDQGHDPMRDRHEDRAAPTVADLADRYLAEHAIKKRTAAADKAAIDKIIVPALGNRKVADVTFTDCDKLHRDITKRAPVRANRVAALLSKMFSLAIKWQMRPDSPAKGIERNQEERRQRYLTADELSRLTAALAQRKDGSADAVRLLLLTGARRGEVLGATWSQLDLEGGIWIKPSAHTKQKKEHRVPLSAPARLLLSEMRAKAEGEALFPGRGKSETQRDLKRFWRTLCKAAKIRGVRLHDLRHTYASILASAGLSLPVIGQLLGHTQPGTTARYSHLFDDPLRAATERVGAIVTAAEKGGKGGAEVRELPSRGRS